MKIFFLAATLFCISTNAVRAQSDSADVVQAVQQMFAAMHSGDSASVVQSFTSNAILQTITVKTPGNPVVRTEDIQQFGKFVKQAVPGSVREEYRIQYVHVEGVLAHVWAPYQFFFNGVFSHCGVNAFMLIQTSSGWKIQYLTDTRVKEGCK
ncbi:MAG TPA: nuclear transport factor 2 family protein [Ferruginibacter sp.]|nr:nuclear transport factor 2 family protein [Ferruginibacter sp.]HRO05540.1 nuclear transport factor 2 family protein [Ferruginibacter sp.]HRO96290.1 nuclear transport factor 2 family protein [Ferruginibacter sp.]HRP49416.1 nuclear transport factor 2 family protein [Ferruginibacter sp.]